MIKVDEDQAKLFESQVALSKVRALLSSWSAYASLHSDGDTYRRYHAAGVHKCIDDLQIVLGNLDQTGVK